MKTIAAIVLLSAASGAFASEYTNFEIPPSRLTRAEVIAAIQAPNPNGIVVVGDATQFVAPQDRINTRNASVLSFQPRSGRI